MVLEDDPYSLLRFEGDDLPSLRELGAGRARVIAVHTFSKILAPGLRVGWVLAEPEVIARMVDAPAVDGHVHRAADAAAGRAVPVRRARRGPPRHGCASHYHVRKLAMQEALADELGELGATWTDPHGGFFLWLTLPEAIDTEALFAPALAEGVAYIPGPRVLDRRALRQRAAARVQRRAAGSRPRGDSAAAAGNRVQGR